MILQSGFVELEDSRPKRTCVGAVGGAFTSRAPVSSPGRRSGRDGEAQRPVSCFFLLEPSLLLNLSASARFLGIRTRWKRVGARWRALLDEHTAIILGPPTTRDETASL